MSSTDPSRGGRRAPAIPKALLLAVVLVLALAVGVAGFLAASSTTPGARPSSAFAGPVFAANLRAPSFSLTDQDGKRASLSQYRGQVVVLSFMYSRCSDACPLMATEIRGALDRLPPAVRVPVLAISVDPARDSRKSARAFLAREDMTGRMRFLLGAPRDLRHVWKRYAIQPEFDRSGRQYRYGHSAYVMLIDRRGFLRVGFPASQLVPEDLVHDLKLLLDQRA